VCNAAESLLVHEAVAEKFLPDVIAALSGAEVLLHVAPEVGPYAEAAGAAYELATAADYATEWHRLEMNLRTVATIDEALEHIHVNGTTHTEVIVTEDRAAARRFVAEVDAAVVMVNASSRFTDGGQFGMGAEIGISTQKLHARGPMALPELTTTKWVVEGDGQVRG
jgi:glutamate-5-semialdehyde dehydrogenase